MSIEIQPGQTFAPKNTAINRRCAIDMNAVATVIYVNSEAISFSITRAGGLTPIAAKTNVESFTKNFETTAAVARAMETEQQLQKHFTKRYPEDYLGKS